MNTKDGVPYTPDMTLWGCYRDATGDWFLKEEHRFECDPSNSYADRDKAIDFIIWRIRGRLAERVHAAEGEIARWQARQTQHCCGASGFNPMLGDNCPACDKRGIQGALGPDDSALANAGPCNCCHGAECSTHD